MNKHHRRVAVATATGFCGLLVIVCAHVEVRAQIVADPNAPGRQRPTVLSAPNGVPLVNIQTPSAAGVSRNTYRQFDVNGPGAILNNSRTATPTQLGGHVPGNPWLATGSARIILNEVNSTNPSYLKGPIEVAGQRAEAIVANPAGIQVNGGSFINASAVTLTTGTPVMNTGNLESFRVRGGQINVDGLGLDMRGASHAAILARAIEVNAAIWAQYLSVVGGAAEVRVRQGSATTTPEVSATPIAPDPQAPGIPKPVFWLDTAAIGGMYAGKIFLVGSEHGLGVNNKGTIASQGQLTLLPNGQLINSGRVYGQNIQIQSASEVRNQDGGVIAARESLNIQAAQIHNTEGAELLSLGKMALTATERIENRSARIEAQGDLAITTPVLVNANDHFRTELVAEAGQRYLRLRHQGVDYKAEELGMNFDRLDRYEDKAEWQVLLPSGEYPFAQYPALAAQWAVPLGGWSGSFQVELSRTEEPCPGSECNPTTRDTYAPEHPIWQRLGVTPFGPPPEPPPQGGSEDPAWQQQMAQYNAHKRAQQDALDQKIGAYNASVAARTLEDWVVIDATATAYNPKVVSSAPGQIVSGRDIRGEHLVRLDAAQDTHLLERDTEVRRRGGVVDKGAHQSKTEIDQLTLRSQAQVAELNAGNAIHIESPKRIELLGARLQAPDIYLRRGVPAEAPIEGPDGQRDIKADLLLGAVVERDVHSSERRSESDRVWQSTASHGHELDTLVPTELHGKVHIDPGLRIGVQVPQGAPVREQARLLSEQPGLAYLGELAKRDDVDWQAIELARRQWDHEQQGLTGLGAAIVTVVVAYFTAGAGSGVVGTTAPTAAGGSVTTLGGVTLSSTATGLTAAGAAVNAGFTALVSTTAVSFINNGGDLGAVLKDLGSSESVKAILTSMVTAGVAHNIGKYVSFNGKPLSDIKLADGPGAYLGKQLVEQTGRAVVNAALQGTDLEDAIVGALVSSALTTVTEFGSKTIGDLTVRDANGNVVLNPAGQKLAHALLGCAAGAVQTGSEGCAAGAAGGVLGHLAAEWIDDGTRSNADITNFAKLIAGLGGALVALHTDGDAQSVTIASTAGENAAANNYLNHVRPHPLRLSEVEQFARASADCATGDASACQRRDALADLSRQRDRELQTACNGATPALCQQLSQQAASMGNVVRGQPGQLVWANSPDSGFVLNVATVGTPSRPGNFHDQQANNTSQALLFALPGPEDLAVGALLLTAPGKVLAEVVVQGGQKMLRFADGVLAPVGSQQAKLLAEARVRNNVYRDGGISDPTRPMSAAGPWTPAAELSTQQANQLVALSLPVGSTVTGMRSADVANALAKTKGYEAPFVPGSSIVSLNAAEGASMVRVYVDLPNQSSQVGTWVMRAEDVAGLTAEQIASKYALPQVPTKITDVVLPKGVTLEVSIAGSVSPGASRGIYTGDNGGGGGVQFQIQLPTRDLEPAWFVNERTLK